MNCSIENFFIKFHQIRRKLPIWSNLLNKSSMETFIFCTVYVFPVSILSQVTFYFGNFYLLLSLLESTSRMRNITDVPVHYRCYRCSSTLKLIEELELKGFYSTHSMIKLKQYFSFVEILSLTQRQGDGRAKILASIKRKAFEESICD